MTTPRKKGPVVATRLGLTALSMLLACCSTPPRPPAAGGGDASGDASYYVLLGPGGAPVARAIVPGQACPSIRIDGLEQPMSVRAAPAALAPRKPQMAAPDYKPVEFARLVCEKQLPEHVSQVSIGGRQLPVPKRRIERIVVIGDTGCRVKRADKAFQRCDPEGYRFGQIASAAAAKRPDLVIHVGDYHYRESSCPEGAPDCSTTSWGYGWDVWRDDFFVPARALLQAAPWVPVRGNHEMCARAGQGWWRFLSVFPLQAGRDCNATADDDAANYSAPYAVPIGEDAQLIVLDSADAGNPASRAAYAKMAGQVERMARQARFNIVLVHHPILGFAKPSAAGPRLAGGSPSLDAGLSSENADLLPDSVQMILSGHIHVWEQVGFAQRYPTQFIVGISGTREDTQQDLLRAKATQTFENPPQIESFSEWVGEFGFMTMDRTGPASWDVRLWDEQGRPVKRCRVQGKRSACEPLGGAP